MLTTIQWLLLPFSDGSIFAPFEQSAILDFSRSTGVWQTHPLDPVRRGLYQPKTAKKHDFEYLITTANKQ